MNLQFVQGDVTSSAIQGKKVLVHCCNDNGILGAGVAGAIRSKWPHVNKEHVKWFEKGMEEGNCPRLGDIQLCKAEPNFVICNLIGQKDMGMQTICGRSFAPIRYEAITEGLWKLREKLTKYGFLVAGEKSPVSIVAPRFGCGLAGGTWDKIEKILNDVFGDVEIDVVIYDFQ